MSTTVTYRCDCCGVEKKESNHWIGLRQSTRGTILPALEILAFMDCGPSDTHICGSVCLIRKVTAFEEQLRKLTNDVEREARAERRLSLSELRSEFGIEPDVSR